MVWCLSDANVAHFQQAAGILLYAKDASGEVLFLLGLEKRKKDKRPFWHILGGKKEEIDKGSPYTTALREMGEESLNVFAQLDTQLQRSLVEEATPKFWEKVGSYVLFFVEIPYDESVPHRFAQAKAQDPDNSECKHKELRWFKGRDIMNYAADRDSFWILTGTIGTQRLYKYCSILLSNPKVSALLQNIVGTTTVTRAKVCLVGKRRAREGQCDSFCMC